MENWSKISLNIIRYFLIYSTEYPFCLLIATFNFSEDYAFYLFQKFSKNGARVEEKGDVLLNEIADNIQKMLKDKVEAVKVRNQLLYVPHHEKTCLRRFATS